LDLIELYTDGSDAKQKEQKDSAWSFIIVRNKEAIFADSGLVKGNHVRAEITAIYKGLETINEFFKDKYIKVFSDLESNIDIINGRKYETWFRFGNLKGRLKAIKHEDLWRIISGLAMNLCIEAVKVKSHSGDKFNEMADRLAYLTLTESVNDDANYLNSKNKLKLL
jgi:ribonuclease HI